MSTVEERFWAKVDKNGPLWNGTPCWLWTAYKWEGYGKFKAGGKQTNAHRIIYEWAYGLVDPKWHVDHLCRNHGCVNLEHLEAVTEVENIRRGTAPAAINARKTHCLMGHPFTPENTYTEARAKGGRGCRICRVRRSAEGTQRRREKSNAGK